MLALSFLKLSTFFNKYLYIIIGIVALVILAIVLPNAASIGEKFGLETRATLKADLAKEEVKTETAIKANETLVDQIEKDKKVLTATVTVVEKLTETKTDITNKISSIKIKKVKKITAVAKKDVSQNTDKASITIPTNNPYTPEIAQGVAETNIDSIWAAYEDIKGV